MALEARQFQLSLERLYNLSLPSMATRSQRKETKPVAAQLLVY